ncbi:MAG: 16S rRNA (guanine(527)-N(7))-methyltransferase RsmG [Xanthomonadales bacterium]|nr:16S rRNA (guanine(527)-N(7))-methyltransferase RsmG [Xanthomonadales bacterium]
MLSPDPARRLAAGLDALGLPEALREPLSAYLDLLLTWNRTYNLTAIRDPAEMVSKHLLDSLVMAPFFGDRRLADLGTGAGLPGIPLALACPELRVSLVESAGKKARFMRHAVRALGLADRVRVLEQRVEAVEEPGEFDCLTARALGTLALILDLGGRLLRPDGQLLAMKGQVPDAEIAALPDGWAVTDIVPLRVPGLDAERHLIRVARRADQAEY